MPPAVIKEAAGSFLPIIAHALATAADRPVDSRRQVDISRKITAARALLPRRALGEDALQGAAMHVQPTRGFRDVAVAHLVDALDVLPADAVRRHRIDRQFRLLG